MTKQIYIASFEYGKPRLARVELIKETPKTYTVDGKSKVQLLDSYVYHPERISKSDGKYYVAKTKQEALNWLIEKMNRYIEREKKGLEQARKTKRNLEKGIKEVNNG